MPFRAFDDSDKVIVSVTTNDGVLMPFRAFDDSDPLPLRDLRKDVNLSLNALPGIR